MASTIECETLLQIEDSLVYNILLSLPIRAGFCPPDLPSTFHVWSVCVVFQWEYKQLCLLKA